MYFLRDPQSYTKRAEKEFNKFRTFFQILVCKYIYMVYYKLICRLEVHGLENVPKNNEYIVCANHLSSLDPPLMCGVMPRRVSFMAKKELFQKPLMRLWMDWLGAFAVNREKLGASTIKTAMSIKNTDWVLGLFPQGTRGEEGIIKDISKGFASIAKVTKCGILPVGILGTHNKKILPFTGKIIVKIGEVIPYNDDFDQMVLDWARAIEKLTGFKYEGQVYGTAS